ncbi:hypothetical protein TrVE_jg851 [Triparma verrucosa]|uniref:DOMON domain-containing protein n=1 Tax=Triparma verrucosa TaxID=1606542 RepID=A0A9W7CCJ5_9STRA|nr:hypothetical protein TrVE_jg851 [Triparma verrucosa]
MIRGVILAVACALLVLCILANPKAIGEKLVRKLTAGRATHTLLKFKRYYRTCDEGDIDISVATNRIIFASGDSAPSSKSSSTTSVPYHSSRGSASLRLRSADPTGAYGGTPPDTPLLTMDFKVDDVLVSSETTSLSAGSGSIYIAGTQVTEGGADAETVKSLRTSYVCKGFSLEALDDDKYHGLQFSPIITEGNGAKVHHILLYQCPEMAGDAEAASYQGRCWGDDVPLTVRRCNFGTIVAAWAIGGGPTIFPPAAGMPFGNGVENKHLLMEVHYDNFDGVNFNDSSGLRMFYTPTLRPNDVGVMYTGALPGIDIPPGEESYELNARCPTLCTTHLQEGGVKIFSSILHAHTAGRAIHASLLDSSGNFKASLGSEPYYDFNFQSSIELNVTMNAGDEIHTTCQFNTEGKSENTKFGLATDDEMCLTYLWYYPLQPKADRCIFANVDIANYELTSITDNPYDNREEGSVILPVALCENANFAVSSHLPPSQTDGDAECVKRALGGDMYLEGVGAAFDEANYMFESALDENYKMYWSYDEEEEVLSVAAKVKTTGWVGLGFGRGNMIGSDVVLGWVDDADGAYYFSDRFAKANVVPEVDESQDYWGVSVVQGSCDEDGENCNWEQAVSAEALLLSAGVSIRRLGWIGGTLWCVASFVMTFVFCLA